MNTAYSLTEQDISEQDEEKLRNIYERSLFEFKIITVFILVISLVLPFLPPKYSGNKAILDIMSYYSAVAGILFVFCITGVWAYYYMIVRLKRDIKEKRKVVLKTTVLSKRTQEFRGVKSYLIKAAGLPAQLSEVTVSVGDFDHYEQGKPVRIEFSKITKRQLGVYRE